MNEMSDMSRKNSKTSKTNLIDMSVIKNKDDRSVERGMDDMSDGGRNNTNGDIDYSSGYSHSIGKSDNDDSGYSNHSSGNGDSSYNSDSGNNGNGGNSDNGDNGDSNGNGDKREKNNKGLLAKVQASFIFRLLCSLLLALVVWLTLNSTYVNPPAEKTLSNVPLLQLNRSVLENYNLELKAETLRSSVGVSIKGRQEEIDKLSASDFEAVIDFSNVSGVDTTSIEVELRTSKADNVSIIKIEPTEIPIELERRLTYPFDITVNFVGELPQGFYLTGYSRNPAMKSFSARESLIGQIDHVDVEVDLTEISGNTVLYQQCRIFNRDGVVMNRQGWEQVVEISLEISKDVPVFPVVTGTPADDYYLRYTSIIPEVVRINGSKEALEQVDSLYTEILDINNARMSVLRECGIVLPSNVKMSLDALPRAEIDVTINMLQYTQDFSLSKGRIELINNQDQYRYEIVENEMSLLLKGKVDDIASLDSNQISAVIDVERLTQGTHAALAILTLPEGIICVNDVIVTVIVARN